MFERCFLVLALLAFILLSSACWPLPDETHGTRETRPVPDGSRTTELLPFGNPSGATEDRANKNNFLVLKRSFALSYNNDRGTMNWIAWRTTKIDLGESLTRPLFQPDPDLPEEYKRIVASDYSGSGYDRGHMVPSADRFGDPASNSETFQMTNIVPQSTDLNQYIWEKLERYSRGIVRRGGDLYTIAGVYGEKQRIKSRLTVPTNCWKIILVLPPGGSELNVDERTRVIAVDMPNENGIKNVYWQNFRVPVREIEQKTGYNFLSGLPQEMQDKLEMRVDDY